MSVVSLFNLKTDYLSYKKKHLLEEIDWRQKQGSGSQPPGLQYTAIFKFYTEISNNQNTFCNFNVCQVLIGHSSSCQQKKATRKAKLSEVKRYLTPNYKEIYFQLG